MTSVASPPSGPYLIDTNVLLRLADPTALQHVIVVNALTRISATGSPVNVTPQNLTEFWNVATRPVTRNGFGLSPADAAARVRRLLLDFALLPDSPEVFPVWRRLAESVGVSGVQVHDARLIAFMAVYSVPNLLTLNAGDFSRFTPPGVVTPTGITVIDPAAL